MNCKYVIFNSTVNIAKITYRNDRMVDLERNTNTLRNRLSVFFSLEIDLKKKIGPVLVFNTFFDYNRILLRIG